MTVVRDAMLGVLQPESASTLVFRVNLTDGEVFGRLHTASDGQLSEAQLESARWAVEHAAEVKRLAVAFVRAEVLSRLAHHGLLELDGTPCEWTAPYFEMSETEYFADFQLETIEAWADAPHDLRLWYGTELDPEHGVPVQFSHRQPIKAFA